MPALVVAMYSGSLAEWGRWVVGGALCCYAITFPPTALIGFTIQPPAHYKMTPEAPNALIEPPHNAMFLAPPHKSPAQGDPTRVTPRKRAT